MQLCLLKLCLKGNYVEPYSWKVCFPIWRTPEGLLFFFLVFKSKVEILMLSVKIKLGWYEFLHWPLSNMTTTEQIFMGRNQNPGLLIWPIWHHRQTVLRRTVQQAFNDFLTGTKPWPVQRPHEELCSLRAVWKAYNPENILFLLISLKDTTKACNNSSLIHSILAHTLLCMQVSCAAASPNTHWRTPVRVKLCIPQNVYLTDRCSVAESDPLMSCFCRSTHAVSLSVLELNHFFRLSSPPRLRLIQIIEADRLQARFSLCLNLRPNVSDSDGFILQSGDTSLQHCARKTRHAPDSRWEKCKHLGSGKKKGHLGDVFFFFFWSRQVLRTSKKFTFTLRIHSMC